jgi:hypothetical protein
MIDSPMGYDTSTTWPGVLAHHAESCPKRDGGRCTCGVTGYRAKVEDPLADEPVLGPIFPTVNEADRWRREQQAATDAWHAVSGAGESVGDVIGTFLDGIDSGRAVDERGMPRPPEELAELKWALRALQGVDSADGHALLGELPIGALDANELHALIARLDAAGLSQRRTHSVLGALRALLRFAAHRGLVAPSAADALVLGGPDELAPRGAAPTGMAAILAGPPDGAGPQPNGTAPPPPVYAPTPAYGTGALPTTQQLQQLQQFQQQQPVAAPAPTGAAAGAIPDEVIWMILKVVAIVFALIALVLAAVGLYAVTAYAVTQRTQEIGVRMALGAQSGQVVWLILRRVLVQLAIGLGLGIAGAFAVGQVLRSFLVQTSATDPVTLAGVAMVLLGVSIVACVRPAYRATRLDPVVALRCD